MKRFAYFSYFTMLVIGITSCGDNLKYHPVNNQRPRVSTLGFYVSPPPGNRWYEKQDNDSLLYFKRITPGNYALTTKATELMFTKRFRAKEDFLEYVRKTKEFSNHKGRYRNDEINLDLIELLSSICVRYEHSYEDYGTEDRGNFDYITVFSKGLVCIHPDSPKTGIDVSYMERSFPHSQGIPSYRSEGEQFLSSLKFYRP